MNHLKEIRNRNNLALVGLAVKARTSPATVVAIEKYGYEPGTAVKAKLALVLGVEISDIWPKNGRKDKKGGQEDGH